MGRSAKLARAGSKSQSDYSAKWLLSFLLRTCFLTYFHSIARTPAGLLVGARCRLATHQSWPAIELHLCRLLTAPMGPTHYQRRWPLPTPALFHVSVMLWSLGTHSDSSFQPLVLGWVTLTTIVPDNLTRETTKNDAFWYFGHSVETIIIIIIVIIIVFARKIQSKIFMTIHTSRTDKTAEFLQLPKHKYISNAYS